MELGNHSISVSQAIAKVDANAFVLPALQRGVVWDEKDIAKLFDSIYKDYPFGSLLILKLNGSDDANITTFYNFNKNQNLEKFFGNEDAVTDEVEKYCVLDGQQRLTALYRGIFLNSESKGINKFLSFSL